MLTAIWGEVIGAMDKSLIVIDKIRKQSAFKISKNNKKIVFITMYRIPQSSDQGAYKAISQYNNVNKQSYSATKYRKDIFQEIENYIQSIKELTDIVLGGNINQNILYS